MLKLLVMLALFRASRPFRIKLGLFHRTTSVVHVQRALTFEISSPEEMEGLFMYNKLNYT